MSYETDMGRTMGCGQKEMDMESNVVMSYECVMWDCRVLFFIFFFFFPLFTFILLL